MLYYCKTPEGNFGDDLNPWLWSRLAPEVCDESDPRLFIGIGTILSHRIPSEGIKIVLGAGCGYSKPPVLDSKWRIYAVRGPLTAARLKLDSNLALTDPAMLVRKFPNPSGAKTFPISFMPHHQSMLNANWVNLCSRASIHCIDPRNPVEKVLSEIQQSEVLLAEAMHGAIVADALRVPWVAVRMYSQFLDFKWNDWSQSINVPLTVATIPPVFTNPLAWRRQMVHRWKRVWSKTFLGKAKWRSLPVRVSKEYEISETLRLLGNVVTKHSPHLSDDRTLARVEERLLEKVSELRSHWRQQ